MNMQGKTAVITGATNGIGMVTARELAKQGARVVIVGRSAERVQATVEAIKRVAGHDQVEGEIADLSLMAQVSALAQRLKAAHPRIDCLINNAGAFYAKREITPEGLEKTFALNHMSYFLLTNLLLETLIASAPARIINVSSDAHQAFSLDFENLQGEKRYDQFGQYARTKLMNLYFTYELARRLARRGIGAEQVTVNALHPGFVDSGFFRNKGSLASTFVLLAAPIFKLFRVMITPEEGAQTTLYLATSDQVAGITAAYFSDRRLAKSNAASHDEDAAKRLWEISTQIAADYLPATTGAISATI